MVLSGLSHHTVGGEVKKRNEHYAQPFHMQHVDEENAGDGRVL